MNLYLVDDFDTDTAGTLPAWFTNVVGTWEVVNAPGIAFSGTNVFEGNSHSDGDLVIFDGGSGVSLPATADGGMSWVTRNLGNGQGFTPLIRSSSNGQNWYGFALSYASVGGNIAFTLYKSVSSSISQIGSVATVSGITWTSGTALHFQVAAIGTTIEAMVWADGTSQPGSYQVTFTGQSDITVAGYCGFRFAGTGATAGNGIDNLQIFGNSSLAAGTITSSGVTSSGATLTSGAATGGTSPYTYQWYRSTSNTFVPQTANLLSGATSVILTDTGLSASTAYYYVIIATDSAGAIAWSSQATITTSAAAATDFSLTSTGSAIAGFASGNYTITPNGTPSSSVSIALSDASHGGTFTPSSLTFSTSASHTFTYTPAAGDSTETITLTAQASGGLTNSHTATCSVTSTAATRFTISPSSQTTAQGVATGNYSVSLNGTLASNEVIALSDSGAGGTFTPSSLTFTSSNYATTQNFTYTPSGSESGTKTLTDTGTGAFSNTATTSCVVTLPLTAGSIYVTYTGVQTVQMTGGPAAGGSGNYTYQWYRSTNSGTLGSAISGATAESYIDTGLTADTNYYYTLVYTDTSTSATGNSSQTHVQTKASSALEIVGAFGDSIIDGSYSTIQTPFSALIDQLNFAMPSKEWYGGTVTMGTSGSTQLSLNLAVSGTYSNNWLSNGSYLSSACSTWAAAGVTRIVTDLGGADAEASVGNSAATFQSNMQSIITYIFANVPSLRSIHIFSPMYQGEATGNESTLNDYLIIEYSTSLDNLANGTTIFHEGGLGPYNYFQRRPFLQRSQDLIHPNDYGDQTTAGIWASQIVAALSGGTTTLAGYSRARVANG